MNPRLFPFAALLVAVSLPARAVDLIESSLIGLGAAASYAGGRPALNDTDFQSAPHGASIEAEALVAGLLPVPGIANAVGSGFASASLDSHGNFGVGVNAFFNSAGLPPETVEASGRFSITFTNNDTRPARLNFDFEVPPPNIQILGQGVGDFFPAGADPARDIQGFAMVEMVTTLTRVDGSTVQDVVLEYGMRIVRDPITGVQSAIGLGDAAGLVERFDVSPQHRDFQLPALVGDNVLLPEFGPGESLEFSYDFVALGSTGFGETGVFAAIGDPFDIAGDEGGRISFELASPVPEMPAWALMLGGLAGLMLRRARWRGHAPAPCSPSPTSPGRCGR